MYNGCKHLKITCCTAVKESNIKATLAVMNTTELVVEIRPSMNYLKYNGLMAVKRKES